MNWFLAMLLIATSVVLARPGSAARERLLGRRTWILPSRLRQAASRGGPRLMVAAVGIATVAAGVTGGPVGAVIAAAYAGLGAHEWDRRAARRRAAAVRAAALDEISYLVAELRAGIPPVIVASRTSGRTDPTPSDSTSAANPADGTGEPDARIRRLTGAVWHLAERTGAPAADLLERIERDARAADRSAKAAAAQSAGAQTTALLLAALPLAGLAMGYVIGGDPVEVLLHTPWGGACAIGALILQISGLKWSQRLAAKVAS